MVSFKSYHYEMIRHPSAHWVWSLSCSSPKLALTFLAHYKSIVLRSASVVSISFPLITMRNNGGSVPVSFSDWSVT